MVQRQTALVVHPVSATDECYSGRRNDSLASPTANDWVFITRQHAPPKTASASHLTYNSICRTVARCGYSCVSMAHLVGRRMYAQAAFGLPRHRWANHEASHVRDSILQLQPLLTYVRDHSRPSSRPKPLPMHAALSLSPSIFTRVAILLLQSKTTVSLDMSQTEARATRVQRRSTGKPKTLSTEPSILSTSAPRSGSSRAKPPAW